MRYLLAFCLAAGLWAVSAFAAQGVGSEAVPSPAPAGAPDERQKDEAFERSLKGQFPMSPEQIEKFRQRMQETKQAVRKKAPPTMVSRTRQISFETGKKPPVVRIAPGYVTTISFFDSTGSPWPISSVALGNPNYYNIERPENQSNIITIAALKQYVDSNLALTFQAQNMPTTVQLTTVSGDAETETDSLVVFRADQRGPNAQLPSIGPEPESTIDSALMQFIDRVPPESAKRVRLLQGEKGGEKEAREDSQGVMMWSYQDSLYLRTRHPLVWPAWNAVAKGPGGVRVYELASVPSVMVSHDGRSVVYDVGDFSYE